MDSFGMARMPRRKPSIKRTGFSFSLDKLSSPTSSSSSTALAPRPAAPPGHNSTLRNAPLPAVTQRLGPETSDDSAPSRSLHCLPSSHQPVEDTSGQQDLLTTTTRKGLFALRHRSSASAIVSAPVCTPALLSVREAIAEGPPNTPPLATTAPSALKGTLRKMFGRVPSSEGVRCESRGASRQSNRDQTVSRSASALDMRSRTPNLLDISEANNKVDKDNTDSAIRPAKSWTNLFRGRSPTSAEPQPPLPATTLMDCFSPPADTLADDYVLSDREEPSSSPHNVSEASETTAIDEQALLNPRFAHDQDDIAPQVVYEEPSLPLRYDSIQAMTADTHVISRHQPSSKPLNFSLPRVRTSTREVMELESYAARISNLEDDMADLQDRMFELEHQLVVIRGQAHINDVGSGMYYQKATPALPKLSTASYELLRRSSDFDLDEEYTTPPAWLRESSSDLASTPSLRSPPPSSPAHPTPPAMTHHPNHPIHSDTTPSLTSTSSPRQSQDSAASYFSPTAKIYKAFCDTKSDVLALDLALDKLRGDCPAKLPPRRLASVRGAAAHGTMLNLESPPLSDSSTFVDPFVSGLKAHSSSHPCIFASAATSTLPDRHTSYCNHYHNHSTSTTSSIYSTPSSSQSPYNPNHISTNSTYHDVLALTIIPSFTPSRSQSHRQHPQSFAKRSSAIVGTARKARFVLGEKAISSHLLLSPTTSTVASPTARATRVVTEDDAGDYDRDFDGDEDVMTAPSSMMSSEESGGWRQQLRQKRSSAVVGTAMKARQVLGAQAIEVGALPVRVSSRRGW